MPDDDFSVRHRNEVTLVGEIADVPGQRALADGAELVTFRLNVARAEDPGQDSLDCNAHVARVRKAALGWEPGDLVEVEGMLRRRFYRVGASSKPFVVVEVLRARRLPTVTRRRKTG